MGKIIGKYVAYFLIFASVFTIVFGCTVGCGTEIGCDDLFDDYSSSSSSSSSSVGYRCYVCGSYTSGSYKYAGYTVCYSCYYDLKYYTGVIDIKKYLK